MNMNKEFIPHEQAIALKELGFDERCFGYYGIDDKVMIEISSNLDTNLVRREFYAAPLYQQAFRWLLLLVNKDKHFTNKWTISYNEDYYSLFLGGCNMEVFKAELECLKKVIEIAKTK